MAGESLNIACLSIEIGNSRIFVEYRAENRFQWRKPRFIVAPRLDALPVYGPPNLFRADSSYNTFGFVKIEAGFLERQLQKLEQPTNLAFRALDEGLIDHTVHLSRQDGVEMRHQGDVITIIPADFHQARSIADGLHIDLREIGKTARQRMAAHVDDLRVRQNEVEQADMREVAAHLVDEKRPAKRAMGARTVKIGFAEFSELGGVEGFEKGGIVIVRLLGKIVGNRIQIPELGGSLYL